MKVLSTFVFVCFLCVSFFQHIFSCSACEVSEGPAVPNNAFYGVDQMVQRDEAAKKAKSDTKQEVQAFLSWQQPHVHALWSRVC